MSNKTAKKKEIKDPAIEAYGILDINHVMCNFRSLVMNCKVVQGSFN